MCSMLPPEQHELLDTMVWKARILSKTFNYSIKKIIDVTNATDWMILARTRRTFI